MGFLTPKKESFTFKRIVAVALLLTIFDGVIYGLPALGLFICFIVFVASAVAAVIFIFFDRTFSKLYAVKCFIYLCAGTCIIFAYRLNVSVGNKNANTIIGSVEQYKADKGDYPSELGDLVPQYMSKVPVCAYRLVNNQYGYSYTETSHYLIWAQLPPYGRRVYHFQNKEWSYID